MTSACNLTGVSSVWMTRDWSTAPDHQVVQRSQQVGAEPPASRTGSSGARRALAARRPAPGDAGACGPGVLADDQVSQQARARQPLGNWHRRLRARRSLRLLGSGIGKGCAPLRLRPLAWSPVRLPGWGLPALVHARLPASAQARLPSVAATARGLVAVPAWGPRTPGPDWSAAPGIAIGSYCNRGRHTCGQNARPRTVTLGR